jgi:DNA-binding transcriptional regulator YiaG
LVRIQSLVRRGKWQVSEHVLLAIEDGDFELRDVELSLLHGVLTEDQADEVEAAIDGRKYTISGCDHCGLPFETVGKIVLKARGKLYFVITAYQRNRSPMPRSIRNKCPVCGMGIMIDEVIACHSTRLGGVPVEVANARITKCDKCGEVAVDANELNRWEEIQKAALYAAGHIACPAKVRSIRQSLGLSVSDFAKVLAVTRQTVHAWEREGMHALQLGPAALLLDLLAQEAKGSLTGVVQRLVSAAMERGQQVAGKSAPAPAPAPGRRVPFRTRGHKARSR